MIILLSHPIAVYAQDELELLLLAGAIEAECADQPLAAQCSFGSMLLNRINDDRFPDTLSLVIFQNGQFKYPVSAERLSKRALDAAFAALNGSSLCADAVYFTRNNPPQDNAVIFHAGEYYFFK